MKIELRLNEMKSLFIFNGLEQTISQYGSFSYCRSNSVLVVYIHAINAVVTSFKQRTKYHSTIARFCQLIRTNRCSTSELQVQDHHVHNCPTSIYFLLYWTLIYQYITKRQYGAMNFSLVSCHCLHNLRLHLENAYT